MYLIHDELNDANESYSTGTRKLRVKQATWALHEVKQEAHLGSLCPLTATTDTFHLPPPKCSSIVFVIFASVKLPYSRVDGPIRIILPRNFGLVHRGRSILATIPSLAKKRYQNTSLRSISFYESRPLNHGGFSGSISLSASNRLRRIELQ